MSQEAGDARGSKAVFLAALRAPVEAVLAIRFPPASETSLVNVARLEKVYTGIQLARKRKIISVGEMQSSRRWAAWWGENSRFRYISSESPPVTGSLSCVGPPSVVAITGGWGVLGGGETSSRVASCSAIRVACLAVSDP